MQLPYSAIEPHVQGKNEADLDAVNIGTDDDLEAYVLAPGRDTKAFLNRLPEADPEQVKWAIITLWEGSPWQEKIFEAPTAIYWLQITGHISAEQRITSPDNFLRLWVQREREIARAMAQQWGNVTVPALAQSQGGTR